MVNVLTVLFINSAKVVMLVGWLVFVSAGLLKKILWMNFWETFLRGGP